MQAIEVAGTLPFAHGEIVEQIVATGLRTRGRDLVLSEDPLETLDGEAAHVLNGIAASHDDVHTCKTAHGSHVDYIVLNLGIAEPSGHEVFDTMDGGRCHGGLFVGLGDTQVVGGETLILARHIDAGLEVGVIDGETLYNFHLGN